MAEFFQTDPVDWILIPGLLFLLFIYYYIYKFYVMIPAAIRWIIFYPLAVALVVPFVFAFNLTFFREYVFGDAGQRGMLPIISGILGPVIWVGFSSIAVVFAAPSGEKGVLIFHFLVLVALSLLPIGLKIYTASIGGTSDPIHWNYYAQTVIGFAAMVGVYIARDQIADAKHELIRDFQR